MNVEQGSVIDRYEVIDVIGSGGMATVYRVRHVHLGTLAALKVLHLPGTAIRDRLLQEGRIQASLQHPNIVAVTDVVVHQGNPGLVMEYVRGPSLDRLLTSVALDLDQSDALARGIIAGVRAAHRHGMVHRDLKPANILLAPGDDGPIPKIADFGLAKALQPTPGQAAFTRTGGLMGTPMYMAPEQARDAKNVDERVDVWALGAILYEVVTGRRAFEGGDTLSILNRVVAADYPRLSEVAPHLPPRMVRAIEGALTPALEDRIASCDALWETWTEGDHARAPSLPGSAWGNVLTPELFTPPSSEGFASAGFGSQPSLGGSRGTFLPSELPPSASATSWDLLTESIAPPAPAPSAAPPSVAPAEPPSTIRLVGFLVAATLIGVLGWLALPPAPPTLAPLPPAVVPAEVEAPVEVEAPTEPPAEAPVEPPAEAEAAPEPVPAPAPTPAPSVAPAPVRPAPTPEPTPPAPEPVATPSGNATVAFVGDASSIELISALGRFTPPDVPPGTYAIRAVFADALQGIHAGEITLTAGQTVTLRCVQDFHLCRPTPNASR